MDGSGPHAGEPRIALRVPGLGTIRHIAEPGSEAEMQRLLDRSQVDGVVRVLPGFAHDIERGRTTSVQVLLDGTNSNTASIVSGYAGQAIQRYGNEAMEARQRAKMVAGTMSSGGPMHAAVPQVESRTRVWFNPDLRSRNYFIPGVVVNIIMLVTLSLTTMAIVREKEIGTMEQLMVTPHTASGADSGQDAAVRADRLPGYAAGCRASLC